MQHMKAIIIALLVGLVPIIAMSQTRLTKSYPVAAGQKIKLNFDYPKVIHISSWDKKEVLVEATVKINDLENNNAFTLQQNLSDGVLAISNQIDMKQIPETYYVSLAGIKTRFSSKKDMESFINENKDRQDLSSYMQRDIQVTIDIKVPSDVITDLHAVYGLVELDHMNSAISVEATYGGIDASLNEEQIGQIKLTNRYGNIFSNLNLKPSKVNEQNYYTSITASPGKGPSYDISSSYGNIYLRKGAK
jgi:hypothetical protein